MKYGIYAYNWYSSNKESDNDWGWICTGNVKFRIKNREC